MSYSKWKRKSPFAAKYGNSKTTYKGDMIGQVRLRTADNMKKGQPRKKAMKNAWREWKGKYD